MPSTPKDVRARIAQAMEVAQDAGAAAERDSRAALDRLLARPADTRFAALEDGAPQLLPEHRRELLSSLRAADDAAEAPRIRAAVPRATRFEVWRGRLPFQARRLVRDGLLGLCFVAAVGLAYRRTPVSWVEIQGTQDIAASWVMPDGRVVGDRLVAGRAYAMMRIVGTMAELREWRSGNGYAEARVAVNWLQSRSEPNRR